MLTAREFFCILSVGAPMAIYFYFDPLQLTSSIETLMNYITTGITYCGLMRLKDGSDGKKKWLFGIAAFGSLFFGINFFASKLPEISSETITDAIGQNFKLISVKGSCTSGGGLVDRISFNNLGFSSFKIVNTALNAPSHNLISINDVPLFRMDSTINYAVLENYALTGLYDSIFATAPLLFEGLNYVLKEE